MRSELVAKLAIPIEKGLVQKGNLLAYPHHWQVPAATEKMAFETLMASAVELSFAYIGFPWATIIDAMRNDAAVTGELLRTLGHFSRILSCRSIERKATVAQHIHADRFIDVFRSCGVTDLFWSHARIDQTEIRGVSVHPFPLFPAQTPNGPEQGDLHRRRRYLANFIGAYNPTIYLSDVRKHIFDDAEAANDLLIIKRDAWHFDRAVYYEQISGMPPDEARLVLETQHKLEYLQAIRDSVFTLCPTGSGPNSIRICEALALGSIPIILTRDLALPGNRLLWESACVFEEDSVDGYRRALAQARAMPEVERHSRQEATRELFAVVGPQGYGDLIVARFGC